MSKYRLAYYNDKGVFYIPVRNIEEAGIIADTLFAYNSFLDKENGGMSELEVFDKNKNGYIKFDTTGCDDPIWYNHNLNENKDELVTISKEMFKMNGLFQE